MINVTLNPIADAHCSIPFPVTACVVTDVSGPVRICAQLAGNAPCTLVSDSPGPGPDHAECVTLVAIGDITERPCATIMLTAACPDLHGGTMVNVSVTATNAAGEKDSASHGVHITCP